VVESAVFALGHLARPEAIPLVLRHENHADKKIRHAVTFALGCFPNDDPSIEALLRLSRDPESEIRDWAVFGLGVLGKADSPDIREALLRALEDADENVREEAAVGLGKRRDKRLLPKLWSMLGDPELKIRVAEAARPSAKKAWTGSLNWPNIALGQSMKRSAIVRLTIVAAVGMAAHAQQRPNPCALSTFSGQACSAAVTSGGYCWNGKWVQLQGHYPYPYYYDHISNTRRTAALPHRWPWARAVCLTRPWYGPVSARPQPRIPPEAEVTRTP
jgi:hypothetical protein